MHELPDEHLVELLPAVKKIAVAVGVENYNVLQVSATRSRTPPNSAGPPANPRSIRVSQNNGRIAHQEVDHVHFHMIPKPKAGDDEGLVVGWPAQKADMDQLKAYVEELKAKI